MEFYVIYHNHKWKCIVNIRFTESQNFPIFQATFIRGKFQSFYSPSSIFTPDPQEVWQAAKEFLKTTMIPETRHPITNIHPPREYIVADYVNLILVVFSRLRSFFLSVYILYSKKAVGKRSSSLSGISDLYKRQQHISLTPEYVKNLHG